MDDSGCSLALKQKLKFGAGVRTETEWGPIERQADELAKKNVSVKGGRKSMKMVTSNDNQTASKNF